MRFLSTPLILVMVLWLASCQNPADVGTDDPIIELQTVAAPAFSPQGGAYTSKVNVTISCATAGAGIRYTLDGSNPAEDGALTYTEPVEVGSSLTLKAIAKKTGWMDSTESSVVYTITPPTGDLPAGTWIQFIWPYDSTSQYLAWVSMPGVTGYTLERSTSSDFEPGQTEASHHTTDAPVLDRGLQPQTTYYYRVMTHNAAGSSTWSSILSAATPDPTSTEGYFPIKVLIPNFSNWGRPTHFRLKKFTPTEGSEWNETIDVYCPPYNEAMGDDMGRGYATVYRRSDNYSPIPGQQMIYTLYDDLDENRTLDPEDHYCNLSQVWLEDPFYTTLTFEERLTAIVPDVPTGLRVSGSTLSDISLVWDEPSTPVDGFQISFSQTGVDGFNGFGSDIHGTSFTLKGMQPTYTYLFKIRAFNGGAVSSPTEPVSGHTFVIPVPAGLTITASTWNTISLSWDQVEGATSYRIYHQHLYSDYHLVGEVSGTTTYIDTGLLPETTYRYYVTAYFEDIGEGQGYQGAYPISRTTDPEPVVAPPDSSKAMIALAEGIQVAASVTDTSATAYNDLVLSGDNATMGGHYHFRNFSATNGATINGDLAVIMVMATGAITEDGSLTFTNCDTVQSIQYDDITVSNGTVSSGRMRLEFSSGGMWIFDYSTGGWTQE